VSASDASSTNQTPSAYRREGRRFTSAILPPWARRSPKVTELLPVLYLRGISTKDFEPALAEFFGSEAGLSASGAAHLRRRSQSARIATRLARFVPKACSISQGASSTSR
jgi:hypothetical protein